MPSRLSHLHRGASLHRKGNAAAAKREYQQHLAIHPGDKTAHYHLALAWEDCGSHADAVSSYRKAIELDPYYPEALNNLGILFQKDGNLDAARICFARALASRPGYNDAEYNYATVEGASGNHQAALLHFTRVLERDPQRADAWNNLGKLFLSLREPAEAQHACEIALKLDPRSREAAWNHSVASLTLGQLPEGWTGFECRNLQRHSHIPRWNGEPLKGRHLLVHAEQGIGDTLQFVRYCSHVQTDHIRFECHPELVSLLSGTLDCVPFGAELPNIDVQIPLMSLPGLFQTTLWNIPGQQPYVAADPAMIEGWNPGNVPPDHSRRRVGIVWAGNPNHEHDRLRSINPGLLEPLGGVEGVSFYCLQQQSNAIAPLPFVGKFENLTWTDTAAIVAGLDLIITVDTAVAHLAGALGRPVWTLLAYSPDWRWMLDRTDTPWYPTMRLFRQPRLNDWPSVIAKVATELQTFCS